jgi:hypothetical protein
VTEYNQNPASYVKNFGKSEEEMKPIIAKWEAERAKQQKSDDLVQLRRRLQLITEAGIPCGDLMPDRDGFTMFLIESCIEDDPVVRERSDSGKVETINIVCRMSLTEKAELRTRVGQASQFADINQRCSSLTTLGYRG